MSTAPRFDEIIHARNRLQICGLLAEVDSVDFATVQDGAVGVHFVHAAVESGRRGAWVDASYTPPLR